MNKDLDSTLLKAYQLSFKKENSNRSNERLKVLHGYIANEIARSLAKTEYEDFTIHSHIDENNVNDYKTFTGKEKKVEGKFNNKTPDIVIEWNSEIIAAIEIKMILTNYNQNANNYFETVIGNTVNLQSVNIPTFQILFLPSNIPYCLKDKDKTIKSWSKLEKKHLSKYISWCGEGIEEPVKPRNLFICIYDVQYSIVPKTKSELVQATSISLNHDLDYIFQEIGMDGIVFNNFHKFIDLVTGEIIDEITLLLKYKQ